MINSSDQLSKSIQLNIHDPCPERWTKTILINEFINHALRVTHIYDLKIQSRISSEKLNEILRLLPNVNSLEIYSLQVSEPDDLSDEEIEFLCFLSTKNQIKKLCLRSMTDIKEFYMLALICPLINHLQIKCVNYMHAQSLTGLIVSQINIKSSHSLRSLCFSIRAADDNMVEKLKQMIVEHNLRFDFMIRHEMNKIYLEWK
jgi:hypothetical protein